MSPALWAFVGAAVLLLAALLVSRRRAARGAIVLGDPSGLAAAARRTGISRWLLVAALAAATVVAALLLRSPRSGIADLVPGGRTTIVALDMSASISDLVYAEIARTLTLITTERRDALVGLVLFSDVGQEVLPPGTPARELRPFVRFFEPLREASARARPDYYRPAGPAAPAPIKYPLSPWYAGFAGGTKISSGLATAREMAERDGLEGTSVLLVSDLEDTDEDQGALVNELTAYARTGLRLDVIAVPPGVAETRALYGAIIGDGGTLVDSRDLAGTGERALAGSRVPLGALVAIGMAALLLAAHAAFAAPLTWGTRT